MIARNSSFTYKGKPVDVKQAGREMGVRYLLEGSVRKSSDSVRITTQLIDAANGAHLWANRFDGTLTNVFELQDQVAAAVVGAILPALEKAEIERTKQKPTDSLDAYDNYLRGMANIHRITREAMSDAFRFFYKAIELDPDFATAYAMAAWCYARSNVTVGRQTAEKMRRKPIVLRSAPLAWQVTTQTFFVWLVPHLLLLFAMSRAGQI